MLTNISKISEQILLRLNKNDDDRNLSEREVGLAVHQSLATVLLNRYYQNKTTESYDHDGSLYYPIHKNVVKQDPVTDYYYIRVPSSTISLPFGTDISRVGSAKGRGYIETPMGFLDLYADFESSDLEGNIGYYRQGANIYFVNMDSRNKPKEVSVTMVLPIDKLGEDGMLNIPADMVDTVVETVLTKFAKSEQLPDDEVNNSIDE